MVPPEALREEVQKVTSLISSARRLAAGGTLLDLSALSTRIGGICRDVKALPLSEGRDLRPLMQEMLEDLDRLEDELKRHYEDVGLQLARETTGFSALKVYEKKPADQD